VSASPGPAGRDRRARLLAGSLVAAFLVLAFLGLRGQDPTSDERLYFGVGRTLLLTGRWQGFAPLLHPPLSYYVNSLPLLLEQGPFTYWNPLLLRLCRVTSLLAFGVPLLVAVFLWARDRAGSESAAVAVALIGFSPTLLAHAGLITPDLPLTATGFVALYLFWKAQQLESGPAAWGASLGLALLAKGSGWLFVVAIVGLAALRRTAGVGRLRPVLAGLAVALFVLNLGYGFTGLFDLEGKRALLEKVPDVTLARAVAWAAAPFFPLPYLKAMATQLHVAAQGWPSFLAGEVSRTGWRHYFLVALALKETVPFLILLAVSLARAWRRGRRLDDLALLLPAGLFFVAFSLGGVQIGVRYVLPALPFVAVLAAGLVRDLRPVGRAAVLVLVAWHAMSAVRACPHFIAYFNELAGGPENGYRYLGDSNLDWGQNRSQAQVFAWANRLPFEPPALPASGRLVVSATRLQGTFDRETYRVLREQYDPVGHVGYAYLVYDLARNRRRPPLAP